MKRCRFAALLFPSVLCSTATAYVFPCVLSYGGQGQVKTAVGMGILGALLFTVAFFAFVLCAEKKLRPDTKPEFSAVCRHAGRFALAFFLLLPLVLCISLIFGTLAYILRNFLPSAALQAIIDSAAGVFWLLFSPIVLHVGMCAMVDPLQPPIPRSIRSILPAKRLYIRLLLCVGSVSVLQTAAHIVCKSAFSSLAAQPLRMILGSVLGSASIWMLLSVYTTKGDGVCQTAQGA